MEWVMSEEVVGGRLGVMVEIVTADDEPSGAATARVANAGWDGRCRVVRPKARVPSVVQAHRKAREVAPPPSWQAFPELHDRRAVGQGIDPGAGPVQHVNHQASGVHPHILPA